MSYSISKKTTLNFEESVEKAKKELQKEGFGVLTEIDVRENLREKLNVEHENYVILGACNPLFANKALKAEKEIGLLLPCNIIIYQVNDDVFISAINPVSAMGFIQNKELKEIAESIKIKLETVIHNI